MDNWYVLRVKWAKLNDSDPDEFYYDCVEWHGDEPLQTDMNIEFDNGEGIESGTFEIVASDLTEQEVDRFLEKVAQMAH